MRLGTAIEHLVEAYKYASDKEWIQDKVAWALYHTWKEADDRKTEPSSSEKPNNCEHITEDGVTCAKYPACDDCLDNPLNKVKGSERLVKGSEHTEPTCSILEHVDKDINVRSKTEPQAEYKKWEVKPNADRPTVDTTCVGVAMALVEDEEYPRCAINGTSFDECGFCEHFNCDTCKCESQTERSE